MSSGNFVYFTGMDYSGTRLNTFGNNNITDCLQNCQNDPNCQYAVMYKGTGSTSNANNKMQCDTMRFGGNTGGHTTHGAGGYGTYVHIPRSFSSTNAGYIQLPGVNMYGGRESQLATNGATTNEISLLEACDSQSGCNLAILKNNGQGWTKRFNVTPTDGQDGGGSYGTYTSIHPDVAGDGANTTYVNVKSFTKNYCEGNNAANFKNDTQCQKPETCKSVGPNGNCDAWYTSYCSQGNNIFSDNFCSMFQPTSQKVSSDLKMAYCATDQNFLKKECLDFCTATTGAETSPAGYKEQCNNLYTQKCSVESNYSTSSVCACVMPQTALPDYQQLLSIFKDGGVPDSRCYVKECVTSGYKISPNPTCNSCIQHQTISVTDSSAVNVSKLAQTCNVTNNTTNSTTNTNSNSTPSGTGAAGTSGSGTSSSSSGDIGTDTTGSSSTTTPKPSLKSFPWWGILLIVLAIILLCCSSSIGIYLGTAKSNK